MVQASGPLSATAWYMHGYDPGCLTDTSVRRQETTDPGSGKFRINFSTVEVVRR